MMHCEQQDMQPQVAQLTGYGPLGHDRMRDLGFVAWSCCSSGLHTTKSCHALPSVVNQTLGEQKSRIRMIDQWMIY